MLSGVGTIYTSFFLKSISSNYIIGKDNAERRYSYDKNGKRKEETLYGQGKEIC